MAVIGFFNTQDFLDEIDVLITMETVRLQAYHRITNSSNMPIARYEFFVEAAVEIGRDVFVCRIKTGSCQVLGNVSDEKQQLNRLEARNNQVKTSFDKMITDMLEGKVTAPGLIAAASQSDTVATWKDNDDASAI